MDAGDSWVAGEIDTTEASDAAGCVSTHPSTGITDESDEERRELGPADLRGGVVGHGHEAFSACFPHPPHVIGA